MTKLTSKEGVGASSFNDIDIISMGTLYLGGPWEKKYWSSSRGKDRYPYPVGYQAARTYNGILSTMQVQQGNTGPLFVITSSDGETCYGPTPNIVWKKFQRVCSPHVKSLLGKRSPVDMDGVEFFGFKHDLVQRLLRQMVTDETRATRVSTTQKNTHLPNQNTMSAISPELLEVHIEDKRGGKRKISHTETIGENKPKKHFRSSTAPTEDFAKPLLIERQTMEDDKLCASLPVDMLNAERSPTSVCQEEAACMSNQNINFHNDALDSDGEEITMSMMRLLLPQAVPLLREARKMKKKTAGSFQRISPLPNITHRDHAKEHSISDAKSMGGMRSHSVFMDPSKTKNSFESSKIIDPDSFDSQINEHTNVEQLPDVSDHCDELDDILDPFAEHVNNAFVPDSCDELDDNACAPDSCDELDNNAYALDFFHELDDNEYALDSCDEREAKETIPDSCKELTGNGNNYVSDSSDEHLEDYCVPDSCDETDQTDNVPGPTGFLTDVDVRTVHDSNFHSCEGKEVPCSSDSGIFRFAKSMDRNEAVFGSSNFETHPKERRCGTRFSEYKDSYNDNVKHRERLNLASQQQNTNQIGHRGITRGSDELNGGGCPVLSNGCQSLLDKCVLKADLEARPNQDGHPKHNLYDKVVIHYEACCSRKHDGQCKEGTVFSAIMPISCSSDGLRNKTLAVESYEDFVGAPRLPRSDMVTNGEHVMSAKNLCSISETLQLEQSKFIDDSHVSAGQRASHGFHSKLSTATATECDNKLRGLGKFIGFLGSDVIANEELLRRKKNVSFESQTSHYNQSASVVSNTSASQRALDRRNSQPSTTTEQENKVSDFEKLIQFPCLDISSNVKLVISNKSESFTTETLYHQQSASVHDINESSGRKPFDGCNSMVNTATKCENKISGFGNLFGLYVHPTPILSVLLCSNENETYICTSCGAFQDNQRDLFTYKIKIGGGAGSPYFVGHSPMILPDPKCFFGRKIALDKSGMQFTPNGQNLVLLNGMQLPSCSDEYELFLRNGLMHCQCSECEAHSFEENAVKIVQLKRGYVTVLAKMKTVGRVLCLLVCEPNYIVAVEANGAFRLWTMNSTWRYVTEEFFLPPTDCISPCAIELKQIPYCPHLVVGHNCLGEFGLWDISRRTVISKFCIPDIAIFQFVPVSLYLRDRKDNTFSCLNSKEHLKNGCKGTSKTGSSQKTTSTLLKLSNVKDIVVSILVATCPDIRSSYQHMPDGCWKLGLLMNHKVFLKATLDTRAFTVAASGDYGVLGTSDGYLHVWDLSTGLKLGGSLCFKDGRVKCLYADTTRSGLLAVTDDKGNLLLYFGSEER